MKTKLPALLLAFLSVLVFSCKDQIDDIYTVNAPVYLTYDELRGPLKIADGQDIIQPGKIYFKDNYILVNEYQKGIHVINNTDPSAPEIVKFIEIPGNVDMAVRGNILYADSYVDLVAIDISNLEDIEEVGRVEEAFPYMVPECEDGVIENVDQTKGVVTGWKVSEVTVPVEHHIYTYEYYPTYKAEAINFRTLTNGAGSDFSSGGAGTGGSMARFTIFDHYLYAIDQYMLRVFDLSEATDPESINEFYVGWNIETLFPYNGRLFIGSTTGMYIYSLSVPSNPEYISTFWHATGCDPVVAEDNLAYVTLRAGNMCGNNLSQLDVIDISDITTPKLLKEYVMEEPYGLGIDNHVLFVCDGEAGLKIFDASDPMIIDQKKIAHYPDINAWDVIPLGDVLVMIGSDGLYQYDYSDLQDVREISVIPLQQLVNREE